MSAESVAVVVGLVSGAVTLSGAVLAVGISYGKLKGRMCGMDARLARVEAAIGNGEEGVLVRKAELELVREVQDAKHSEAARRLEVLESWRAGPSH